MQTVNDPQVRRSYIVVNHGQMELTHCESDEPYLFY